MLVESVNLLNTSQKRLGSLTQSAKLPIVTGRVSTGSRTTVKRRKGLKSSLYSKSETVAPSHLKQAVQRRHIIETARSHPFQGMPALSVSSKLRRHRGTRQARMPFIPAASSLRWEMKLAGSALRCSAATSA